MTVFARRAQVIAALGLGAAVAVSGCSSSLDKPVPPPASSSSSSQPAAVVSPGQVAITFTVGSPGTAPDALNRELSVIQQRITSEKLSDTTVSISRDGRGLIVQGPVAVKDQLEMLGRAGVLGFRTVLATGADTSAPQGVPAALWQRFKALDCKSGPAADPQAAVPTAQIVACQNDGSQKYVLDATAMSGTSVTAASASTGTAGNWQVNVTLNSAGAAQFGQVTSQLAGTGKQFAITVDGVVYSAPTVEQAITGGDLQISGGQFTQSTAQSLAAILQNGALPAALNVSGVTG